VTATDTPWRVLVVDDQHLVRAGLVRILDPEPDLTVVGECEDGDEVPDAVQRLRPHVIVMDVRMKRVDGAEATRQVRAADGPPVLALTTFGDEATVAAALGAGAAGFVLKDARGEELIGAVRAVAAGGAWLDPQIAPGVLDAYRRLALPRRDESQRLDQLTDREHEVLCLIARGRSNTEIAAQLVIGEGTVKTHVGHILAKLGLRDRAAAIVLAFDHGLVAPGTGPPPD
jgi:DNA-binding NarL/FixJ family response regulator